MQLTEDVHVDFVRRIVRYIARFKCVLCVSDRECICSSVVYEGDIRSGALHENTHVSRRDRVIIGDPYDRIIDQRRFRLDDETITPHENVTCHFEI